MLSNPLMQLDYAEVHVYRRVSTGSQDLERQDHMLKYPIQPYSDAIMHADKGYSGSDRTRPSLHQMTGFLNIPSRKPKLVIVETIDRLYRDNTGFLLFIEKYVMQHNVHLWFPSQSIFLCQQNAMDENMRMLYTLIGAMAENELQRISKRTKQSLAAKKAKGETLGRPRDTSLDMDINEHYFQGLSAWKSSQKLKITVGKVQRARAALGLTS